MIRTGICPRWTAGGNSPAPRAGQPELLAAAEYAALGGDARAAYDEERLDYHTRLGVVGTSVLRQVVTTGRRLTLLNRHAISARRGLILSGAAGTGKTTAITQLGKTHEATDRARHPGQERIPVIYVTVPPAATPRMLAMEFARFLGLPVPARANMTDIIEAVCGVAIDTSASMVLVDEIHNMQLATRSGAEVSDTLKYLSERIPATFVYAGIDLERQGLFSGIRGSQIAGRFTLIPTLPFPLADEWRGLVATLEDALRLRRHQAGTLAGLDRYLHQRTGGMIGSLSHLIRGAAIEAIQSGTEQITRKLLDTIDIDHAAQQESAPGTDQRPGRTGRRDREAGAPPSGRCRSGPGPSRRNDLSYIRRLAVANHLRPMHLRRYLATPPPAGSGSTWLAVLAGRPVAPDARVQPGSTRCRQQRRATAPQRNEGRTVHAHPPRCRSPACRHEHSPTSTGSDKRIVRQALRSPSPRPAQTAQTPALAARPLHRHHRCHARGRTAASRPSASPRDQADPRTS